MKFRKSFTQLLWNKRTVSKDDLPLTAQPFSPGELVFLQWVPKGLKKPHLNPRNYGPFVVLRCFPHHRVQIRLSNGLIRKTNSNLLRFTGISLEINHTDLCTEVPNLAEEDLQPNAHPIQAEISEEDPADEDFEPPHIDEQVSGRTNSPRSQRTRKRIVRFADQLY